MLPKVEQATGREADKSLLRNKPTSDRLFWKDTLHEHLEQRRDITDKSVDGTNKKELTANVLAVLALNEVAYALGEGFFFHLTSRDRLKKGTDLNLDRRQEPPGFVLCAILLRRN